MRWVFPLLSCNSLWWWPITTSFITTSNHRCKWLVHHWLWQMQIVGATSILSSLTSPSCILIISSCRLILLPIAVHSNSLLRQEWYLALTISSRLLTIISKAKWMTIPWWCLLQASLYSLSSSHASTNPLLRVVWSSKTNQIWWALPLTTPKWALTKTSHRNKLRGKLVLQTHHPLQQSELASCKTNPTPEALVYRLPNRWWMKIWLMRMQTRSCCSSPHPLVKWEDSCLEVKTPLETTCITIINSLKMFQISCLLFLIQSSLSNSKNKELKDSGKKTL
jgi:hypothetical protein